MKIDHNVTPTSGQVMAVGIMCILFLFLHLVVVMSVLSLGSQLCQKGLYYDVIT